MTFWPTQKNGQREHLVVVVHNKLWWPIARRLVRVVDFSDGTYMVSWRWSKQGWLVGVTPLSDALTAAQRSALQQAVTP